MKPELTLIPRLTIHPNKICTYNEIHWDPYAPTKRKLYLEDGTIISNYDRIKDSDRQTKGKISINARRKISKAVDYLLLMSKPQSQMSHPRGKQIQFCLAFITLTLPSKQIHTDNEIKSQCLNQFLIELKTRHRVSHYVWRAEKQKNGNIHFHIIVNKFINWNELRNRWNRIINKLGYIDRYQENQKAFHSTGFTFRPELSKTWDYEHQLKAYKEGARHDFRNPNSTDVHSIKKIRNLKNYVTKYMTKNEDDKQNLQQPDTDHAEQIGRLWGCDTDLSDIKGAQLVIDNEISTALGEVIKIVNPHKFNDTYFSVYYIDVHQLAEHSKDVLFLRFAEYMSEHFNYHAQLEI